MVYSCPAGCYWFGGQFVERTYSVDWNQSKPWVLSSIRILRKLYHIVFHLIGASKTARSCYHRGTQDFGQVICCGNPSVMKEQQVRIPIFFHPLSQIESVSIIVIAHLVPICLHSGLFPATTNACFYYGSDRPS